MQRINISVDLDDAKFLTEEIEKAIDGAVKARVRETFDKTVEQEVNRIVGKRLEEWTYVGFGSSGSRFNKEIRGLVDEKIKDAMGDIEVSSSQITERINEKLKLISDKIDMEIARRVGKISVEEYIAELVAEEVKRSYPDTVLRLIIKSLGENK